MERDLVHDYLKRSGMEPAQAEALSQILGQTVTRRDIAVMDERLHSIQVQLDTRLEAMQTQLDTRLESMQTQLDTRLEAMQTQLDTRLEAMQTHLDAFEARIERKLSDLKSDLTWRFVALIVLLATVLTVIEQLLS